MVPVAHSPAFVNGARPTQGDRCTLHYTGI
jgi:hypothetical protein